MAKKKPEAVADLWRRNAVVVKISDGDTFRATVDLGYETYRSVLFRMARTQAADKNNPTKMLAATEWLKDKLKGGLVVIESTMEGKLEKWRRYLAEVYIPGETVSVNSQMLAAGMAVPWDGKGPKPDG